MGAGVSTSGASRARKQGSGPSRGRERYSKSVDAPPKQSFVSALVNGAAKAYAKSQQKRSDGWGVKQKNRHFIDDNYNTVAEVAAALKARGLSDCNLIVGIDFTKSNEWTGKKAFGACGAISAVHFFFSLHEGIAFRVTVVKGKKEGVISFLAAAHFFPHFFSLPFSCPNRRRHSRLLAPILAPERSEGVRSPRFPLSLPPTSLARRTVSARPGGRR